MGLLAFAISVVAAVMSFFEVTRLPAFIVAIVGIIYAIVTGYQKGKKQEKSSENKTSEALEVGAAIISGVVCVTYLVLLWF